jgi:dTMP kinase
MRILIEGLDLSGKTTLALAVAEEFTRRGRPAVRHRGMLTARHPARRVLRRLPLVRQPDSAVVTTSYLLAGYALDGALIRMARPQPGAPVFVQDGYADRMAAYGMAGGPYLAAALALRWPGVFASFDVAVYVHAPRETRRVRLAERTKADRVDIRSVDDPAFAEAFTAFLVHGMGRRHRRLLVFDTSLHTPKQMAAYVVDTALEPAAAAVAEGRWTA